MQWSTGYPFVPSVLLDRLRLRRAAQAYAAHGWVVLPGACRPRTHAVNKRMGCPIVGCEKNCPLLLATGGTFDVIEVPARVGLRALGTAQLHAGVLGPAGMDHCGPVAVGPTGRWMFFVRPGVALRSELDRRLDVVLHGPGSRVPAAPSKLPEGAVHWALAPNKIHWRLPESADVQALLVEAYAAISHRPARKDRAGPPTTVPRQLSTLRRAI